MSITVIKKGSGLEILDASAQIPEGVRLVLYTKDEMMAGNPPPNVWEAAQLDSVFREDDEDWGDSLDRLLIDRD
ncbi:MAG TPA: hypothetical protein PLU30_23170 [Verrucomicrobiae bacterium]|nr:hypothetical protein [Verrucomicrobiae bacterium]